MGGVFQHGTPSSAYNQHPAVTSIKIIDSNIKKFSLQPAPTFFCIFLLVNSGTQCTHTLAQMKTTVDGHLPGVSCKQSVTCLVLKGLFTRTRFLARVRYYQLKSLLNAVLFIVIRITDNGSLPILSVIHSLRNAKLKWW